MHIAGLVIEWSSQIFNSIVEFFELSSDQLVGNSGSEWAVDGQELRLYESIVGLCIWSIDQWHC